MSFFKRLWQPLKELPRLYPSEAAPGSSEDGCPVKKFWVFSPYFRKMMVVIGRIWSQYLANIGQFLNKLGLLKQKFFSGWVPGTHRKISAGAQAPVAPVLPQPLSAVHIGSNRGRLEFQNEEVLHIHALQTAPKWLAFKVWALSFPKQILDFHGLPTLMTHNSVALWSIVKFSTSFGSSDLSILGGR